MMLLSGSTTPLESMPVWLKYIMMVISPTPHFVIFAQDVLYRGADFSIVWPEILATAAIGACLFRLRALSLPPRHFQRLSVAGTPKSSHSTGEASHPRLGATLPSFS